MIQMTKKRYRCIICLQNEVEYPMGMCEACLTDMESKNEKNNNLCM